MSHRDPRNGGWRRRNLFDVRRTAAPAADAGVGTKRGLRGAPGQESRRSATGARSDQSEIDDRILCRELSLSGAFSGTTQAARSRMNDGGGIWGRERWMGFDETCRSVPSVGLSGSRRAMLIA